LEEIVNQNNTTSPEEEDMDQSPSKMQIFEETDFPNNNFDINSLENLDSTPQPIEFNWNPPERFRAKLYNLDGDGRWHDLGTGHFSIVYTPEGSYKMKLIKEPNN
jgi:hypothetical protein